MDTRTGEINTMEHFKNTLPSIEIKKHVVPVFRQIKDNNGDANVPNKYRKKVQSGRWEYLMKGEYFVAITRKSNGEEIFFNDGIEEV